MPSKNPAQRLADIIDNVDAIQGFTAELDFPAFRADRKTVYAVVRALEIISEASRRLPDDLLRRSIGQPSQPPVMCTGTNMKRWMRLWSGTQSDTVWLHYAASLRRKCFTTRQICRRTTRDREISTLTR